MNNKMEHLKKEERETVKKVANELLETSSRFSEQSSYAIKHIFERITGIYISNEDMKEIMADLGFLPDDNSAINPRYKAKFKNL